MDFNKLCSINADDYDKICNKFRNEINEVIQNVRESINNAECIPTSSDVTRITDGYLIIKLEKEI